MSNEFTLKDNSSKPYGWVFENVDLTDIDDLREWVETTARGLINGQNFSETPDAEVYANWLQSGELEAVLDLAEEMMSEAIKTDNGTVTVEKTET